MEKDIYDAVIVDALNRGRKIKSKVYTNASDLLDGLGWHFTLMSTIIFRQNVIKEADFEKYYSSNFIHHATLMNYIAQNESKVYWLRENLIKEIDNNKEGRGWFSNSIEIFGKNWCEYILSLPESIPLNIRRNAYCNTQKKQNYSQEAITMICLT